MTRKQQLEEIFNYLRYQGVVKNKKDMASQMHMNYTTLTNAFNGLEKYLTKSLFVFRIGSTYSEYFDMDWLASGEGDMLRKASNQQSMIGTSGISVQAQNGAEVNLPSLTRHPSDIDEIERLNGIIESLREKLSKAEITKDKYLSENLAIKSEIKWLREMVESHIANK